MFLLYLALALVALILLAVAAFFIEQALYRTSRKRTIRAVSKLKALIADVHRWLPLADGGQLHARITVPLSRLEAAASAFDRRVEALEHDNDLRLGPHTRTEWRHLRRQVNRVLRRARIAHRYFGFKGKRDATWPFTDDHAPFYSTENYAGRRMSKPRVWGKGALDEHVLPSAQECREAIGSVAVVNGPTASARPAKVVNLPVPAPGISKRPGTAGGAETGVVVPFRRRSQK